MHSLDAINLFVSECSVFALTQLLVKVDCPHTAAMQGVNMVAHCGKHTFNLVIFSLADSDLRIKIIKISDSEYQIIEILLPEIQPMMEIDHAAMGHTSAREQ